MVLSLCGYQSTTIQCLSPLALHLLPVLYWPSDCSPSVSSKLERSIGNR